MRGWRDYAVVTAAYWVFTITDGALRMLVLLFLNRLGYTPLQIASLFLFYEFFGVVTNLVGGWLGARFGLKSTLFAGLALQVAALGLLGARASALTVPLVMAAQALSGIAKDLTKMSAKSYVKLVVPEGDRTGLMKWVAVLTGSKNTLKGAGFFVGAALLALVGFRAAMFGMTAAVALALAASLALLPRARAEATGKVRFTAVFSKDPRLNWLSAARLFLFGSRDVWFVLALPLFFTESLRWSSYSVGGFMAIWIVVYGIVQAGAPRLLRAPHAGTLARCTVALLLPLGAILAALAAGWPPAAVLVPGLFVFGFVFALNSTVHSYLVVHYAKRDNVSLAVGFYYTANALGRLVGTILSGAVYQASGLKACLAVSMGLVALSGVLCVPLRAAEGTDGDTMARP